MFQTVHYYEMYLRTGKTGYVQKNKIATNFSFHNEK